MNLEKEKGMMIVYKNRFIDVKEIVIKRGNNTRQGNFLTNFKINIYLKCFTTVVENNISIDNLSFNQICQFARNLEWYKEQLEFEEFNNPFFIELALECSTVDEYKRYQDSAMNKNMENLNSTGKYYSMLSKLRAFGECKYKF